MCDKLRKIFSSLLFWFVVVLVIFIAMTVYHYTQVEAFDWKAGYHLASLVLRGFLLSSIFYFLVVYLPSRRKRKIVKSNFKAMYEGLKKDIIREILWCSRNGGRTDIVVTEDLVEDLFNTTKFLELFKGGTEGDEGWYAFCNHIQSNPDDFASLIFKFKILARQLDFILHNYEIKSQEHFDFFKRLDLIILEFHTLDVNAPADEVKIFSRFLWEMLAGWSYVNGYRGYDLVDKFIDEI